VSTFIDKAIELFAPVTAVRRAQARMELEAANKARDVFARYEGASRGRRTRGWTTVSSNDANAEIKRGIEIIRNRARDLARNTWIGRRAVDVLTTNTVGTGIRMSMDGESELERHLKKWARSTRCSVDRMHNLYGIQALAYAAMVESGEALVIRVRQRAKPGEIPLKLKVLEGDYLDHELTEGNIVQGVEYNAHGERVAYHLHRDHPGDLEAGYNTSHIRVPADDVIHLFRVLRPGQVRGISDLAPVIIKIRDWDSFEDAQLVRQQIAACYTAFVRTPSDVLGGMMGTDPEEMPLVTSMEPGLVQLLQPGEDVTFGTPPDVGGYKDFADVTLHEIAAGLGISYEALTGDLRGANFSSARMGWIEFRNKIDADRALILEPRMLETIGEWLLEAAATMGLARGDEMIRWTPPRRQMIDPIRETEALINAVRGGVSSRQSEIRSLGRDPDEVMREIKADNDIADEMGFVFSSDARADESQVRLYRDDTPSE